jgi:hypothetical protein
LNNRPGDFKFNRDDAGSAKSAFQVFIGKAKTAGFPDWEAIDRDA